MSRGLGQRQQDILALIAEAEGEENTVETMRWTLFEKAHRSALPAGDELPTKWNTSFARAVDGLADRGLVTITPRPLESFEECVSHYPGKTLKADARKLRTDLLPVLLEWSKEKLGLSPKYGAGANEEHHWRLLQKDPQIEDEVKSEWQALNQLLRPLYASAAAADADSILRLICRGRYLFGSPDIQAEYPLVYAVERACAVGSLPQGLAARLRDFAERFMPNATAGELKLRSFIHSLADVPSRGQCSLTPPTLEFLHRRMKDYVESMPEFKPKPAARTLYGGLPPSQFFEYPAALMKLFDHSVFQDFRFVALN